MTIQFFVPGSPAPQGSKRHVGRGILIESSKAVGPWRERVALAAHAHAQGPDDGPLCVDLEFVMPRPKTAPKTFTRFATKRPDIDKLARACLDAMTSVCYLDDSQIISLTARKRIAEPAETPGVRVTLEVPVSATEWSAPLAETTTVETSMITRGADE
ncbi:RusA family crossover junction endodeoxyribonuclease [Mycobacteroides sp. PCS013]|uniref:RusA family crossover junction endodeoxyribonuclease n=1 Tax=Mycobacteroides sp. PCS013 TaxID=3074106 RepID=UPI003C2AD18F